MRQNDLAEQLGVSQSRVSRWLAGRGLPNDENVEALAAALGRSAVDLRESVERDREDLFGSGKGEARSTFDRLDEVDTRLSNLERLVTQLVEALDPNYEQRGRSDETEAMEKRRERGPQRNGPPVAG